MITMRIIGLTYHGRDVDMTTDRPAHDTEREIEVTPEMIEAAAVPLREAADFFDVHMADSYIMSLCEEMLSHAMNARIAKTSLD